MLVIADIQLDDQAVYRCRVDFREAKSRNARVNLTVIGRYISAFLVNNFGRRKILVSFIDNTVCMGMIFCVSSEYVIPNTYPRLI